MIIATPSNGGEQRMICIPVRKLPAFLASINPNKVAERQRDEAIRTKAEIGNRREATAMATASAAVRQRDALADRMGEGRKWKTVKAIPWLLDVFAPSRGMYSQVGRKLSEMSQRMGYPVHEVEDSAYGTVKAYHIAVIASLSVAIRKDPAMLGKYRKA